MLRVLTHYRALRTENTVEVRILYQELSRRGRQRCMLNTCSRVRGAYRGASYCTPVQDRDSVPICADLSRAGSKHRDGEDARGS